MRTVQKPVILRSVYDVNRGGNPFISGNTIGTVAHQFLRPDVKLNPKDSSGFRMASEYYTSNSRGMFSVYAQMVGKLTYSSNGVPYVTQFDHPVTPAGLTLANVSSGDYYLLEQPWRPGFQNGVELPSGMQNRVDTKALLNVANRQAAISESLAEMRSTFTGLADNARSIDKFVVSLMKRDVRGMAKSLGLSKSHKANTRAKRIIRNTHGVAQTSGSLWLNYFFGLAPIVDDMVLALRANSDPLLGQSLRITGKSTDFRQESVVKTWNTPAYLHTPSLKVTCRYTRRVGQKTSLTFKLTNERLRELALYGATDLATTAWALAPGSFLVDWVLPVSSVLKALESTWGLDYVTGTRTQFGVVKDVAVEVSSAHGAVDVSGVELRGDRHSFRYLLKTPPSPGFWINDPVDLWKATTTFALLANTLTQAFSPAPRTGG